MRAIISISAVIVLGVSLSGCVAYEVASTAVDATTTVVGGAADVAGDIVTAPFGHSADDKSDKN
jgi:hypothetical protein